MNSSSAQFSNWIFSPWTKYPQNISLSLHAGAESYWGSCQPGVGTVGQPSELPAEGSRTWPERPACPSRTASPGPWCGSGCPCSARAAPSRTPWSVSQPRRTSSSSAGIGSTVGPRNPSTATPSRARSGNRRSRRKGRRGRAQALLQPKAWLRGTPLGTRLWPWACGLARSRLWLLTAPESSWALSHRETFPWLSAVERLWGLLVWRACWICCPASREQRGASCYWGRLPLCSIDLQGSLLRCEGQFTSWQVEIITVFAKSHNWRVVFTFFCFKMLCEIPWKQELTLRTYANGWNVISFQIPVISLLSLFPCLCCNALYGQKLMYFDILVSVILDENNVFLSPPLFFNQEQRAVTSVWKIL